MWKLPSFDPAKCLHCKALKLLQLMSDEVELSICNAGKCNWIHISGTKTNMWTGSRRHSFENKSRSTFSSIELSLGCKLKNILKAQIRHKSKVSPIYDASWRTNICCSIGVSLLSHYISRLWTGNHELSPEAVYMLNQYYEQQRSNKFHNSKQPKPI